MVRFWACVALGRVKDQQIRLAPLLTTRQTDSSEKVRTAARNAFQQLTLTSSDDPNGQESLAGEGLMFEPRLRQGSRFFVCVAVVLLARQPIAAAEPTFQDQTAPTWLERLTSHDDAERTNAAKAIAADPEHAKPVLDEFVRNLGDQDSFGSYHLDGHWCLDSRPFPRCSAALEQRSGHTMRIVRSIAIHG